MKRSTKIVLAVFTLFLLAAAGVAVFMTFRPATGHVSVASKTILKLDLERALPEIAPENPLAAFRAEPPLTLRGLVETLERAGERRPRLGPRRPRRRGARRDGPGPGDSRCRPRLPGEEEVRGRLLRDLRRVRTR